MEVLTLPECIFLIARYNTADKPLQNTISRARKGKLKSGRAPPSHRIDSGAVSLHSVTDGVIVRYGSGRPFLFTYNSSSQDIRVPISGVDCMFMVTAIRVNKKPMTRLHVYSAILFRIFILCYSTSK
jgi:hypothetical protein